MKPLSAKGATRCLPPAGGGNSVGKLGKLLVLTISSLGLWDLGLTRLGLLGTWWWNGASFSSVSSIKLKGSAVEVGRVWRVVGLKAGLGLEGRLKLGGLGRLAGILA